MTETLWRATLEVGEAVGRTLSGIAVPFDKPTLVRDQVGGPFPGRRYKEAWAPNAADVTLRQHASFPVFKRHDYNQDPIGVVTFQRSDTENALLFEAVASLTRDGDEALVMVGDGSMRSVSVGFWPFQGLKRADSEGPSVRWTEVGLRELSLAPTGFGQVPEAKVLAVRSEQVARPILDALQRRRARLNIRYTG